MSHVFNQLMIGYIKIFGVKRVKELALLAGLMICVVSTNAQDIDLATYDTEEEGLYFDQALIYSYTDHTGISRDVWIYYSTFSKRFLFDQAAWGREDEMIHYVIAQPDGSYLTFGTEAEGPGNGKVVTVDSVYLAPKETLLPIPKPDGYIAFVALDEPEEEIAGMESKAYEIQKAKDPSGIVKVHLAKVDFDTRLIYAFNQQAMELRLPELFSNGLLLGADQLITQMESYYLDLNGKKYWSNLKLKAIDPTTYWAQIKDYNLRYTNMEGQLICEPLLNHIDLQKPQATEIDK